MSQRDFWVFCDCPGCPHEANTEHDGMNLCAECFVAYLQEGNLVAKTKYDEDGEPYMEDQAR